MNLSILMPCYLEAENLKMILPKVASVISGINSEILVVDTMEAKDNTEDVCGEAKANKIPVRYIKRRSGNDYGDAIRTGIEEAAGKYLVVMDADGSHNPKDIKRLYDSMVNEPCSVVIGSRYIEGGSTDNPFILQVMSNILNLCYRIIFNLKVKDVSDSFRIYDAEKIKSLTLKCNNFDIVEEILIKLHAKFPRDDIREIPIVFNKRLYGESKRNLIKFIFRM